MRRFKQFLWILGGLFVVIALWAWHRGSAQRQTWAQTLAETAMERDVLFTLRDQVGVDHVLQARLGAWAQRFTDEPDYSIKLWVKQTLVRDPVVPAALAPWCDYMRSRAEQLDDILAAGDAHFASWISLARDATTEEIRAHLVWYASHVRSVAWFWQVEGLSADNPERALRALERIVAPARLPQEWCYYWTRRATCARIRDALYLNLIMRDRLSDQRLRSWLNEPCDIRSELADSLWADRAMSIAPWLDVEMRQDGAPLDRITERPKRAVRRWWYARNKGPKDADWIIRSSVAWERWLRGDVDAPPNCKKEEEHRVASGGRYLRHMPHFHIVSVHAWGIRTAHRNARVLGAALATRTSTTKLWFDEAAFRTAVGERAAWLHGDASSWRSRYRKIGPRRARVEVSPDVKFPDFMALEDASKFATTDWVPGAGSVSFRIGSIEIALPR